MFDPGRHLCFLYLESLLEEVNQGTEAVRAQATLCSLQYSTEIPVDKFDEAFTVITVISNECLYRGQFSCFKILTRPE